MLNIFSPIVYYNQMIVMSPKWKSQFNQTPEQVYLPHSIELEVTVIDLTNIDQTEDRSETKDRDLSSD